MSRRNVVINLSEQEWAHLEAIAEATKGTIEKAVQQILRRDLADRPRRNR